MNTIDPNATATQIGKALDRMVKTAGAGKLDPVQTEELISALTAAPCESASDLLAILAHSNSIVHHACAVLSGDAGEISPSDVQGLLAWSLLLNLQAIATLENATGLSASGFLGTGPTLN